MNEQNSDFNFQKIQSYTFIALLAGISLIFIWMLRPYLYAIFWAAVLAVIFYPLYKKIAGPNEHKKSLAAGLTLIIIVLLFLIPLAGIISLVTKQALDLYQQFGNKETVYNIGEAVKQFLSWPIIKNSVGDISLNDITQKLSSWGDDIAKFVYQGLSSGGQSTLRFIIQFFIMLYALFYFFKDGKRILKKLIYLIPLGDRYEKLFFEKFTSTTKATIKGTLVIGLIQGVIGTIAFLITGVPASAFWGLIMIVFSIIPGLGAAIIMVPAALIMLLLGNFWQAIVIVIFLTIASLIDNLLRGPLVGKDTQMHPLLIFFATLGGLLAFGITGIIIGPVITAFFLSIWEIYQKKYKSYLDKDD